MKSIVSVALAVVLWMASPAHAQQTTDSKFPLFPTLVAAQHHCPFDVVVWLNTKTDTYTVGGPQPTDDKLNGAFMCQGDADQMDYKATQPKQ